MMHKERAFQVFDAVSVEDLAEKLTQHDWCGCNGWRLRHLLFLNDSGDWAIVIESTREQIESVTFKWMQLEEARVYIERILCEGPAPYTTISNPIQTPDEHGTCGHCR